MRVYKSSGNLGLNVPANASSFSLYTLISPSAAPPFSPDLTLFTAFQMLKPPKYSVVLSLDKSIRQHIGFLLKATDCAACIDSSVRQFRLQPRETHPHTHTHTHTQSPRVAHSVSFSEIHLLERKILKLRTGIRPRITQCNEKGEASERRGDGDVRRERGGGKTGEQE